MAVSVSLKDLVRTTIFDEIKKKGIPYGNAILLTDDVSDDILAHSNATSNELLNIGIREKLHLFTNRTPNTDAAAVYFVSPTKEASAKIIEDYKRKLYQCLYIFLTTESEEFYQKIISSLPKFYVNGFVELVNIQWIPRESRVFDIDDGIEAPSLIKLYGAQTPDELNANITVFAKKFQSVLCAMNLDPVLRYHDPNDTQKTLSARFARQLKHEMESYKAAMKGEYPAPTPYDHLGPATVIIVDRAFDVATPLMHTLSYQAAAHDLFDLELVKGSQGAMNVLFKLKDSGKEDVILDETSPLFNTFRHLFLSQAIEEYKKVLATYKSYKEAGTIEKLKTDMSNVSDAAAMKLQVDSVYAFLELILSMVQSERNLMEVVKAEQDLGTGKTVAGKNVWTDSGRKVLLEKLSELFRDVLLDEVDKWRILLLFLITYGQINDTEVSELVESADLNRADYPIFKGLTFFGVDPTVSRLHAPHSAGGAAPMIASAPSSSAWNIRSLWGKNSAEKDEAGEEHDDFAEYDRYQPPMARILTDHLTKQLDPRVFRFIKNSGAKDVGSPDRDMRTILRREYGNSSTSSVMSDSVDSVGSGKVVNAGEGVVLDFKMTEFVAKWGRARPKPSGDLGGDYRELGPKTVVIVLGGLTYAEIRAGYVAGMKAEREVYMGSTQILKSDDFMDALLCLGKDYANPLNVQEYAIPELPPIVAPAASPPPTIIINRGGDGSRSTASNPDVTLTTPTGSMLPPKAYRPSEAASTPNLSTAMYSTSSESIDTPPPPKIATFTAAPYTRPSRLQSSSSSIDIAGKYQTPVSLEAQAAAASQRRSVGNVPPPPAAAGAFMEGFNVVAVEDMRPVPPARNPNRMSANVGRLVEQQQHASREEVVLEQMRHERLVTQSPDVEANEMEEPVVDEHVSISEPVVTAAAAAAVLPKIPPPPSYMEAGRLQRQQQRLDEERRRQWEEEEMEQQRVRLEQQRIEEESNQPLRQPSRHSVHSMVAPESPSSSLRSFPLPHPRATSPTGSLSSRFRDRVSNAVVGANSGLGRPASSMDTRESSPVRSIPSVGGGGGSGSTSSGRAPLTVDDLVTYSSAGMSLDKQVDEILVLCPPTYSRRVLEADLRYSGSVEATLERIFTGVLPETGMQYPPRRPAAFSDSRPAPPMYPPTASARAPEPQQEQQHHQQPQQHHQQQQHQQQQPQQQQRPQSMYSSYPAPPQIGRNPSNTSSITSSHSMYTGYQPPPPQPQPGNYPPQQQQSYRSYYEQPQQQTYQTHFDPHSTPRMEAQTTPVHHLNPSTQYGSGSMHTEVQTTPVDHLNPSTSGSGAVYPVPPHIAQQLGPAPHGMQYVVWNNAYYLQPVVSSGGYGQPQAHPMQHQPPHPQQQRMSTAPLPLAQQQQQQRPTPPQPNTNRYSTYSNYQNTPTGAPAPAPAAPPPQQAPRINQTFVLDHANYSTASNSSHASSRPSTTSTHTTTASSRPSTTTTAPPAAREVSAAKPAAPEGPPYPLVLNDRGEVQDPVPTWSGSWPLVLTGQQGAYIRARNLYLARYPNQAPRK
ncbi:hypothetical protein HDU98_004631 [Podochytrium sp. JEL0797]|nr:hypothetical protein HDU98_004631 [Podochytrium sp. JEL0797]